MTIVNVDHKHGCTKLGCSASVECTLTHHVDEDRTMLCELHTVKVDDPAHACPWCGGTGTFAQSWIGYVQWVPCFWCVGTGDKRQKSA